MSAILSFLNNTKYNLTNREYLCRLFITQLQDPLQLLPTQKLAWTPCLYYGMVWMVQKVVGLERGPLSLVTTIEELLDRKVAAPV
jgi:hypothetical protein